MFDRLAEVQRLLREEFEDSRARHSAVGLSDAELVEAVEAVQRVTNMAQAVQAQRVAQYAAREDVRFEDGTLGQQDRGLGHVSEFAAGAVGPRVGLSPAGADRKVGVSARLASRFAPTLALMGAGEWMSTGRRCWSVSWSMPTTRAWRRCSSGCCRRRRP